MNWSCFSFQMFQAMSMGEHALEIEPESLLV